jgi:dethiobiotin synthetase
MTRGLFITGTGTGVGKTYVAALMARALRAAGRRVGVYKPAASGCRTESGRLISPDAFLLWEAAGRPGDIMQVCPQAFTAPLAPHLAARLEGRSVDPRLLRAGLDYWKEHSDFVLVEGSGGLLSPVSDEDYNADLAAEFGYPLVIVSANELGTINATLQTLTAARTFGRRLPVAGIVLNWPQHRPEDPSTESNRDELVRRCDVPLLAEVRYGGELEDDVDWWALAAKP